MNKMFLKKVLLSVLIVSIVAFGLTGCLDDIIGTGDNNTPGTEQTGTVNLVLSGEGLYNLSIDSLLKFPNANAGQYTLPEVSYGYHHFYASDSLGSCKYDETGKVIDSPVTYIYLNPEPQDGKVKLHLTSTYSDHHYNIKMDGKVKFSYVTVGTYTINNVSTGENHTFEVIHHKVGHGSASQTVSISLCETDVYFDVTFWYE